jgi:nitrate reductase beta subunit
MNHDAAVPKDPAPVTEVNSVRKPMKYLGTLLSTGTEEVLNADGTNKRLTTVRRTVSR